MATILDKLSPSAEIGARLGGGLSSGLQSLVQAKLVQLQNQSGLASLVSPQQAQTLSYLPENLLSNLVPQILKNQQYQQGLSQFMPQPDGMTPQPDGMVQLPVQPMQEAPGQQVGAQVQLPTDEVAADRMAPEDQERMARDNARIANAGKEAYVLSGGNPAVALKAQQDARKLIQQERLQKEKLQAKEAAELSKEERLEKREVRKENKEVIKEITKDFKAAREEDKDLDRLEVLVNSKKITRPVLAGIYKTLGKVGVNLSALMTPESQEFEKLSTGFLKNLKSYFGARITQVEVENFLKTIPSLMQSREGKRRVIYNMKLNNEAKHLKMKAYRKLNDKYKGNFPDSVENMIDDEISPQLDTLAAKFSKGMPEKKRKPKGSIFSPATLYSPSKIISGGLSTLLGKG